jgi:DNA-binding SARP family transcriptional activator
MAVRVLKTKVKAPAAMGVPRSRLLRELEGVWERGFALVVAPAGSGKTTLLSQFAAAADARVAWYQAEPSEADAPALLAHMQRAFVAAGFAHGDGWETVEHAVEALHDEGGGRTLLVVDDFHQLAGTPAEAVLERVIGYRPAGVAVVVGSRRVPAFNLARARLADAVLELGHNDLRFRTWEVEELFHHHYREPLTPEQVAELTRRTEGWAAGLQFFRLAIHGRPMPERARLLGEVTGGSAMFRDFLARDVLAELPPDLREFMVHTSPLGWLSAPLCDAFLGTTGARKYLADAERRQVFTESVGGDAYRYHEVLRSHLEDALQEQLGEQRARAEHRRAGALLEDAGRTVEALRSYCRGEDWAAVTRLAGGQEGPDSFAALPAGAVLPPALAAEPWALLSQARALVRSGRLRGAIERYAEAERGFGAARGAETCVRERVAAAAWVERVAPPGPGWAARLRRATMRVPPEPFGQSARGVGHGAGDRLAEGITLLLAGRVAPARQALADAADAADAPPLLAAAAQVTLAVASLVSGDPAPADAIDWAVAVFEPEVNWLAQMAWSLAQAGTERAVADADAVRSRCHADGNEWGAALAAVIEAELWLHRPSASDSQIVLAAGAEAVAVFDTFGAAALAAWADAGRAMALAMSGVAGAVDAARAAERRAVAGACDLARLRALAALQLAGAADAGQAALLDELARLGGVIATPGGLPSRSAPPTPPTAFCCFGGLVVTRGGEPVDLSGVKPRARSLLRLLAIHPGRSLHREAIVEALWPEHEPVAGTRLLQVAVSALRQHLEPGVARGCSAFVVRDGDGYRLALPDGSTSDVAAFSEAMAAGRECLRARQPGPAAAAMTRALDLYAGDLFPEEGAAEWVVKERHRLQMDAADAAAALGDLAADAADLSGAVRRFEQCVAIDPYRDHAWRRLIELAERSGDRVAASAARRRYRAMLADLDIPDADGGALSRR